jgi:methionyl-tRNA synthetase
MSVLDSYIRQINKIWAANSKSEDDAVRRQTLTDCLHGVRVAAVLLHPIAPVGCEMVREYLNVDERLWSWDYIFEPLSFFFEDKENHKFKFLEPKTDFFTKLDCQFGK